MKIKTRLRINYYISLGVILLLAYPVYWSFRRAQQEEQNANLMGKIENVIFERALVRDEYIINYEERPRIQWGVKAEELRGLISRGGVTLTKAADRELLEEIRKSFDVTIANFNEIVKIHEREEGAAGGRISSSEGERRLFSQLLLKEYILNESIGRLHKSAREAASSSHERVVLFLCGYAFFVVAIAVANSAVLNRIITRRIDMLHRETRTIGDGNLNHRISIKGNDELWELAQATNEMAARLEKSHTSIETLTRETEERRRVEEELRKYQNSLEDLVKGRTADLEGAVGKLNFEIERRKIIEGALRKSEEKYRNLYESMKDGIVMVDMAGKILESNAAYRAMLGYTEEEIRNLTYLALTPEKWHSMEAALIEEQILPRGFSDEYEKEYIRKNGEVFPVNLKTWLIKDEGGVPRRMWGIVKDITGMKRAENEIAKLNAELKKQIRELEDANKELGSFSYSVSHDLKAPLRGIDGFSQIVLDEYCDKLDPEGKRFLEIIRNNVGKMNQLIDDLLSFSRFGRHEIILRAVQMETLAQEAFKEITSAPPPRNIRFEIKPLPGAYADHPMICQVFINLLSNATKFTRPRDLAEIEIGGWSADGENVYYVKDNGVGFDMTYVDKLFGTFQRLHSDSEFEGTGVGLAIVQRIIHRHGGRVWAEGKVNEGATFYFTLPTGSKGTVEA